MVRVLRELRNIALEARVHGTVTLEEEEEDDDDERCRKIFEVF